MHSPAGERLVLTGVTGFVGGALCRRLQSAGVRPRVIARREFAGCTTFLRDLSEPSALDEPVDGMEVVFHCAGFAHALKESEEALAALHRRINCEGTLALARAASRAGVRRFIYCSSVKAGGEPGGHVADETSTGLPVDAYGASKRAAELGLWEIAAATGMEVVVLRPAMIYGPGSRGNVERMFRLVRQGLFPPLPETGNRRSMVFIDDVVDALLLARSRPEAAGGTFIVAHPQAVSGRQLYTAMCKTLGREPFRLTVPEVILRGSGRVGDALGRLTGRRLPLDSQAVSRLLDSAEYSSERLQRDLGWRPRFDLNAGLSRLLASVK